MNRKNVQAELHSAYSEWRETLRLNLENGGDLSSPLLLSVTEDFCNAERRIMVFGQETFGWEWNSNLRKNYPNYPEEWPYEWNVQSMADFIHIKDSVEGLCWGYEQFKFGSFQPQTHSAPFWRAFRQVQSWAGAGVMWSNVAKSDYLDPKGITGRSILAASEELRENLVTQQRDIIIREIEILKPHACIFFSGPYYDPIISGTFPSCVFNQIKPHVIREISHLSDENLPEKSFRTYHPNYLSRSKQWGLIELIKSQIYDS
jgi:hypothetical protein